jgi:hypothetical protein
MGLSFYLGMKKHLFGQQKVYKREVFKHKPMEIIKRSLKFFGNKQTRRGRGHEENCSTVCKTKPNMSVRMQAE